MNFNTYISELDAEWCRLCNTSSQNGQMPPWDDTKGALSFLYT